MNKPSKLNVETAKALFKEFVPMLTQLEDQGIDYCLVGGLAVVAHCLSQGSERLRATTDADLMVPNGYSNQDFASDYLKAYSTNPKQANAIYEALFGDDGFDKLSEKDVAFINISFVGADLDLDGVNTPDFDVCRMLNGRSLDTIKRQRLVVCGIEIWVATVPELLGMKQDTISLYGGNPVDYPREQDFIDVSTLKSLRHDDEDEEANNSNLLGQISEIWEKTDG